MVILSATEAAFGMQTGSSSSQSEDLPIGTHPVFLRFDLSVLEGYGPIERAVLALAPHSAWHTSNAPVNLFAFAVASPWTVQSLTEIGTPTLGPDPATQASFPGNPRMPLRLDVTKAVQAWQAGVHVPAGLALTADRNGVVFTGLGAAEPGDRPRLEVVVR